MISEIPIVITKHLYLRENLNNRCFNFLVLIDGSKKSEKILNAAFKLKQSNDKIFVLSIPVNDD